MLVDRTSDDQLVSYDRLLRYRDHGDEEIIQVSRHE